MIKKVLIGTGAGVVVLGLLFGRDAIGIVTTAADQVSQSVRDTVPVEFEIERARKMIKDLDPEIRRNMHVIAKEEVEVEKLEKQIADSREELAESKDKIMRLQADLDSDAGSFYYGDRRYTRAQVVSDRDARFVRHKTKESTINNLEEILTARRASLDAARQKLEAMIASKSQLEVEIANLQARQKMVEVVQTTSEFNFDDSHLARTKELIDEIGTRIEVDYEIATAGDSFHEGGIPLDDLEPAEDLSEEIAAYFGNDDSEPARLAAHAD